MYVSIENTRETINSNKMWLKNKWRLLNTPKLNSWNGAHLVWFALMQFILNASAKVKMDFPDERISLVFRDNNTLLSSDFLPFLSECTKSDLETKTIRLCAMYYDMVYNVYENGANPNDVKKDIQAANQTLENLSKQFCEFFPEELDSLRKQPFLTKNRLNITAWMKKKLMCELSCLYTIDGDVPKIFPICKLTSAGCKWISKQKRNIPSVSTPEAVNPQPETKVAEKIDGRDKFSPKTSSIPSGVGKIPVPEPESVVAPKSNLALPIEPELKMNKPSQTSSVSKQSSPLDQIPAKNVNSVTPKLNKATPSTAPDDKSIKVAPIPSNDENPVDKPPNTLDVYPTPFSSDKEEEKEDKDEKEEKDDFDQDLKPDDDDTKPDDDTEGKSI